MICHAEDLAPESVRRTKNSESADNSNPKRGRSAVIPLGSWPRRMSVELAAAYCGEATVEAFLSRVGTEYPQPRISKGRRRLWLKDDLDQAILPEDLRRDRDVAEDL